MNYRHAFHAGNHADVFKHVVTLALLRKLQAKPAGAFVLDTHGGRGLYTLGEDSQAARTGEWRDGIGRFDPPPDKTPAPLADYFATLRRAAPQPGTFPGSPRLLAAALREQDRLAACELQPDEAEALRTTLRGWAGCAAHARDGYEALSALLPPPEKRGLVLIDPPYEAQLDEFTPVITGLRSALERWPQGVFALWYPIKKRVLLRPPMRKLGNLPAKSILAMELLAGCVVQPPIAGAPTLSPAPHYAAENISRYLDTDVLWGGSIVELRQFERYAEIEVVAYPLDPQQRPLLDAPEQGRFVALRAGQVDPREFNAGRFLTLRGPITGERQLSLRGQTETIAEMDDRELVLWPWDYRFQRSRVSVSIGVSGRL